MKLIHVTGLVIAVHAAVFVVIFATPGCRSTGRPKPVPEDTAPASVSPVVDTVKPISNANDGDFAGSSTSVTPVAPVAGSDAVSAAPSDGMIRFAPSRPSLAPLAPIADAASVASPSATHTVVKGDNLWSIARKYGITVDELAAANQLAKTASLRLGQTLSVPAKAASAAVSSGGEAANTYSVVSGDTLGFIARKHGTTAAALRTANNLKGDALRIGQKLVIPGNAVPVSGETAAPASAASAPAARPAPRAGDGIHTVIPGDTLGSIARKHGVRVGDLATLNNITDPAKIRVGQTLKLPVGAKAASAPAASSATAAAPVEAAPAPVAPTPVTPVQQMAVPVIRID